MKVPALLSRLLPVLWIALLLLPSLVWIAVDRRPWAWDPAFYGYWTLKALNTLSTEGITGWLNANIHALGMMPPLLVWLAQPFVALRHVVGELDVAFLLLNFTAGAATLAVVYIVVRRLGGSMLDALAAVTVCGAANLFFGITRHFLTEPLQGLAAAVSVLAALHAEGRSHVRNAGLILLMIAVSFLAKATSFIFVLPALTYIAVVLVATRTAPHPPARRSDFVLLAGGVLAFALTAAWYAVNWAAMSEHFRQASTGPAAENYRSGGAAYSGTTRYTEEVWFWRRALGEALTVKPLLAVLLAAVIAAALMIAALRLRRAPDLAQACSAAIADHALFGYYVAGMIVLTVLAYAFQINQDVRFMYSLLPLIGVLAGWACVTLRRAAVPAALLGLFFVSGAAANALTFGTNIGDSAAWLLPVDSTTTHRSELAQAVAESCRGDAHANAIGVSYAHLNGNNANYYAERQRLETGVGCTYQVPPYAEVTSALEWLDAAAVGYVVTVAPEHQDTTSAFANPIARPFAERLVTDARFVLQGDSTARVRIYRRINDPGASVAP